MFAGFLAGFLKDLRYGVRQWCRNPVLTTVILVSLILGIGGNTAIFTLIDAVMLRQLPVKDPKSLVLFSWTARKWPPGITVSGYSSADQSGRESVLSFSYPLYQQIRARNDILSGAVAFAHLGKLRVVFDGRMAMAEGDMVSGNCFSVLGVSTILGRPLDAEDERPGAPLVAVVSYGFWTRHLGGDPNVAGKNIAINDVTLSIAGVAPPRFSGLEPGRTPEFWIPIVDRSRLTPWGVSPPAGRSLLTAQDWWWVMVLGRLAPGASPLRVRAEAQGLVQQDLTSRISTLKPAELAEVDLIPAASGLNMLRRQFSSPLSILMGAVILVLVIACANIAALLLARAAARHRELGVRLAMGASRGRLIRQLLTESVMLASLGGALGLLFSNWAARALVLLAESRQPVSLDIHAGAAVGAFTAAVSLTTGLLCGLASAFRATRLDIGTALKESAPSLTEAGPGGRMALGRVLIVTQVALSVVLLLGAGLFVRTLRNLGGQQFGFNSANIVLFNLDPGLNGYHGGRLVDLYQRLLARIQSLPGVRSATLSQHALLAGVRNAGIISVDGHSPDPHKNQRIWWNSVGPGFFDTMGIGIVSGRAIDQRDHAKAPRVVVVNKALALRFFGDINPIGHRFHFPSKIYAQDEYEIIGVAVNAKYDDIRAEPPPTAYLPYTQHPVPLGGMTFEVRVAGDSGPLIAAIRREVSVIDVDLMPTGVTTQADQVASVLSQERIFAQLCSFFGLVAVLLSAIGLHGTVSYAVSRRKNEIGVRMALGASRTQILSMVLRDVFLIVLAGIAIGAPCSLFATRFIKTMLYGLTPTDPLTLSVVLVLMLGCSLLAGYLPVRRAIARDPMSLLRRG